jgi:hypothetical protein
MNSVSGSASEALDTLDNLSSLGYRLFISDCSHNIDAHTISSLPSKCASVKIPENTFTSEILNERWENLAQFEIVDRKNLVSVLLAHTKPVTCCMINILAVKKPLFEF